MIYDHLPGKIKSLDYLKDRLKVNAIGYDDHCLSFTRVYNRKFILKPLCSNLYDAEAIKKQFIGKL